MGTTPESSAQPTPERGPIPEHGPASEQEPTEWMGSSSTPSSPPPDSYVTANNSPYPVRLNGELELPLNRWLWLVKWLLLIPHAIVLFVLWLVAWVLTIVAGIAILFTGVYPRGIFDFNLGVFRWTWRVMFYGYSALGTDKYPPFTLGPEPHYPATLEIDYPERLSRGLVLVKWWLLAIPHYLVVGVFLGGWSGSWFEEQSGGYTFGLVSLLVFFVGVVLLFVGRYPTNIFEFTMGMNRWAARVLAYAGLMRDEYPPFRLDLGGVDPGSATPARPWQ